MTNDPNKEIDSLLRRLAKTDAAYATGATTGGHIDADEISVFAENALPEKARARVISHIADCGRCRTVLSNVITLNSEAAAKAASPTEVSAGKSIDLSIPWHRKLFSVRGLAVSMGALAVLLAGFAAVFVIRNLTVGEGTVAQMDNANVAALPQNATDAPAAEADSQASTVPEPEATPFPGTRGDGNERSEDRSNAPATPPGRELAKEGPPAATDQLDDKAGRRDQNIGTLSAKKAPADSARIRSSKRDSRPAPAAVSPPAPPPPVALAREAEAAKAKSQVDKDEQDEMNVAAASGVAAEEKAERAASRQISGKTFTRKSGVWYDSSYSGQRTTNVKRGTTQYKALDSGLRTITDKLSGTVVVVWKTNAYRID